MEISMGEDGKLLPNGLQESESNVKTIVCTMCLLSFEPHGTKRTSSFGTHIIGTSRVPSETAENIFKVMEQLSLFFLRKKLLL